MKAIKMFLSWINGKKTTIAALYWGATMPSLVVLFPAGIPADINKWTTVIGLFLTALGVGHKVAKNYMDAQK